MLVLAHDVWLVQLRVGLQHRGALRVSPGQREGAVVHAYLVDPSVALSVGDDRHGEIDRPGFTVEVDDHLPNAAALGVDSVVDVLNRRVACREPRVGFGHVLSERPRALDASADRMVKLGLAGERLNQGVGLTGHQTGEERHGDELVTP
jgi:hypothetical protein